MWRYELVMAMMENFHISLVGHESALPNGFFWRGCPATNHVTVSVVREMIDAIIETQGNLSLVAGQYNLIWEQIVRLLILVIHSQDDSNDIILSQLSPIDLQPDLKTRIYQPTHASGSKRRRERDPNKPLLLKTVESVS